MTVKKITLSFGGNEPVEIRPMLEPVEWPGSIIPETAAAYHVPARMILGEALDDVPAHDAEDYFTYHTEIMASTYQRLAAISTFWAMRLAGRDGAFIYQQYAAEFSRLARVVMGLENDE